jgi:hypothetical protein
MWKMQALGGLVGSTLHLVFGAETYCSINRLRKIRADMRPDALGIGTSALSRTMKDQIDEGNLSINYNPPLR